MRNKEYLGFINTFITINSKDSKIKSKVINTVKKNKDVFELDKKIN